MKKKRIFFVFGTERAPYPRVAGSPATFAAARQPSDTRPSLVQRAAASLCAPHTKNKGASFRTARLDQPKKKKGEGRGARGRGGRERCSDLKRQKETLARAALPAPAPCSRPTPVNTQPVVGSVRPRREMGRKEGGQSVQRAPGACEMPGVGARAAFRRPPPLAAASSRTPAPRVEPSETQGVALRKNKRTWSRSPKRSGSSDESSRPVMTSLGPDTAGRV